MALVLDTGILYAYYDRADSWHQRAIKLLRKEESQLIVPAPVIPEVDHLLGHRLGPSARMVFYRGISEGHYFVADLKREGYGRVQELNTRYAQLDLGFVDAAVVAIAEAMQVRRIATTDRRDFDPLAAELGLELLP
ncbi:MAG TPA: VapC toxin family PIN domain ribonuclease [Thermoanaerobaculia bacterium]|nr:VapC toxin family PIN domain ribonuclease [Thermoanaerobaculia bacterium]